MDGDPISARPQTYWAMKTHTLCGSHLAPELIALIDPGPAAATVRVIDGRIEVKVRLHDTRARTLRRLEAAGLRIHQVARRYVIGAIAVEKLGVLAAVERVERIILP